MTAAPTEDADGDRLNPDCTPGTAVVLAPGRVIAECGCGWTDGPYPSKTKAYAAQKTHRFPPRKRPTRRC